MSNEVEYKVSEKYIVEQYRNSLLDYYTAVNDGEKWSARSSMARLEELAMLQYGFAFADELRDLALEPIKDILVLES